MSDSTGAGPAKKATAKKTGTATRGVRSRDSSERVASSAPRSRFFANAKQRAAAMLQDPDTLKRLAADTAVTAAGNRHGPLSEVIEDLRAMIRLVIAYARGDYRDVSVETLVLVVAALIYVASPLDLIPDFIPVAGFTDDAAVVVWAMARVRQEVMVFRDWESAQQA